MPFRYAQHCPLARAAEIVGQRWTLLIVRELLLGPKRFSDLRRPLPGISTSVLADRLEQLEARGIVAQRRLGPPTPAVLYELTEAGRALTPVMIELGRWGARFLGPPQPGDHFEPDWIRLGLLTFARKGASPALRFAIHWQDREREVCFCVAGGPGGTVVRDEVGAADVSIHASPLKVMALAAGLLDPREAIRTGEIRAEGATEALDAFPALFEMNRESDSGAEDLGTPNQRGT